MSTTKHTLKYGGTPFNTDGTTVNLDVKDIKGTGSAACACGWFSEPLETGAARKEAFKAHKAEAEALDAAEADTSAGETAEPEDATAEAEAHEDASETQADSSEVAEDDDPGTEVAYEGHGAAKSFWKALGVDASAAVAEVFGVTLKYRTKDHTVVLHGDEAETVADMLPRLWAEAQPYFRDWKKSDKKYGAHDKRTKDGLHEAYAMELKFFQELGKGAAAAIGDGEPKKNGSAGYRAGVKLVENGGLDEVADDDLI